MLQPTTELEAVNLMLEAINEPPVNTLEDIEGTEAAIASRVLQETSRNIQKEGWSFNRETLALPPDTEGCILLPDNCIRVTPRDLRYTERGRKLYDRVAGTFNISEPVYTTMVRFFTFEDLPEAARYYIAVTAARRFAARVVGSSELVGLTERDEAEARLAFHEYELEQNRPGILNRNDYAVILRTRGPMEGGGL